MAWDWNKFFIKLTSRKFWAAICGVVTGCILIYKGEGTLETVSGVASALISLIGYIWAEATVDAAGSAAGAAVGGAIADLITAIEKAAGVFQESAAPGDAPQNTVSRLSQAAAAASSPRGAKTGALNR